MAWARIDDRFPRNPKAMKAGPAGRDFHVCGICYCNEHLTDGFVPDEVIGALAPGQKHPRKIVALLLALKLWDRAEGGYHIHDFLVYNTPRAQVLAEREATRVRVAEHRERISGRFGNASSNTVTEPTRNAVGNTVTGRHVTPLVTPAPSHPGTTRSKAGRFTVEDSAGVVADGLGRPDGPPVAPAAVAVEAPETPGPETAGEAARRAMLRLQGAALLRAERNEHPPETPAAPDDETGAPTQEPTRWWAPEKPEAR